MKNKKFASFLAAAAALVLLAMPAFAADEQTELPAAEAAEVQQEQTAAPAEQETALPADAQTAGEPEQQLTYVALGDSITSGVGLADMKYNIAQIGYDLQPNFEGYPSQCYTALVGKGLGLDRQHAINLGLPGLMSPDMLDMVQNSAMPKMNQASGAYYVYPEYQEYLRKADIISIQIGSNDALVPCIVGLGEATNWKSEQLAALMVSGALRDFNFQKLGLFLEALNRMTLTFDESRATNRLLFRGMDEICDQAYTNVTASLPQIVASIRALNRMPKSCCWATPIRCLCLPAWNSYFSKLNRFAQDLAAQEGLIYVDIPRAQTAADGHPTVKGHQYIAQQILNAIQ